MKIAQHKKIWIMLLPWLNWLIAAFFYTNQYFLRVSISAFAPDIVSNFGSDALTLADIAATFYYAFIISQLISGVLLDRFGPRFMLSVAALFCASGMLVFAYSSNTFAVECSRALAGIGASFSFIGVITLARAWFSTRVFAVVTGVTLTIGYCGAILGEGPLAEILKIYNWRDIAVELGIVLLIIATALWFFVRDSPEEKRRQRKQHNWREFWHYFKRTLNKSGVWLAGLYAGFIFVPINAFAALWAAPFLMAKYHIHYYEAGFAASMVFVGAAIGAPTLAWFSNLMRRRILIMFVAALIAMVDMLIILYMPMSYLFMCGLLFLLGFFIAAFSLSFVVVRQLAHSTIAATAFSFTNLLKMLCGTVLLQIIGALLDKHWNSQTHGHGLVYALHDFQTALVLIPICLLLAGVLAIFIREPK